MKLAITILLIVSILAGVALDAYNIADQSVGEPLYRVAFALLLSFLATLPFPRKVFLAWIRFVRWALPTSILSIIFAPGTSGSWVPLYSITKEGVTLLLCALLVLGSLCTIFNALRVKPPTPTHR